jgi:mono/diheme cytochrome c family protein
MKFAAGFLTALVVIAIASLGIVFSGAYNVAATEPHTAFVRWLFSTTMHRSVEVRGTDVRAPQNFTEDQFKKGFSEFNEMCVGCHGAPGKEANEIGKGINPGAPNLADSAKHWDSAHLFWIIKNGIKMTAMPAFAPTHSDDEIWTIIAFVRRLPELTPEQYQQLEKNTAEPGEHGGHSH